MHGQHTDIVFSVMSSTDRALRCVLNVREVEELSRLRAENERHMQFRKLYPHLFLTDADVGHAAFRVTVCDDEVIIPMKCSQECIVFNGRTSKGHYKWGPANSSSSIDALVVHFECRGWFCRHGQEEAWKSERGHSHDEHVDGLVTTDASGNIVLSESQMTNWVLTPDECFDCEEDCHVCGGSA